MINTYNSNVSLILRDKEGRSPRGRSRYSECYNHSTPAAKFSKKERKKERGKERVKSMMAEA